MPEEKPVKYKKIFREALKLLNAEKGLNIQESEIGKLYRENTALGTEYRWQLQMAQKEAVKRWDLKILAIINERTGRSIPPEAIKGIKQGHTFLTCQSWEDMHDIYNMYHQIYRELEQEGKKTKDARHLQAGTKVCRRCGGSGRYSYNQKDLDRCYGCGGSGVVPMKKKTGKGWNEAQDASGKAPIHKAVATRDRLKAVLRSPMEQKEIDETVEAARAVAKGLISNLGAVVYDTELMGSFNRKGFEAKDIDVMVHIDDINRLKGTTIISTKVDGKLLDIFVRDKNEKQGVFEDRGFESYFKQISRGS